MPPLLLGLTVILFYYNRLSRAEMLLIHSYSGLLSFNEEAGFVTLGLGKNRGGIFKLNLHISEL